jgi:hypothetical protein
MVKVSTVQSYAIGTEAVFVVPSESEAIDMVSQTLQKVFAYAKLEVGKINVNHVITFTGHHVGKDAIEHNLWLRKVGDKTYLIIPLLENGLGELEGHLKITEVAFADQFAEQWM